MQGIVGSICAGNQSEATFRGLLQYRISLPPKLKSLKNSFAHNLICSCPIILKFCTEQGSDTAMLCAKFQNDGETEMDVMEISWDMSWVEFGKDVLCWNSLLTFSPVVTSVFDDPHFPNSC